MEELTEFGEMLKNRINMRRKALKNFKSKGFWEECLRYEAQISELEMIWVDLTRTGILHTGRINKNSFVVVEE